jgi:hypothetical protein
VVGHRPHLAGLGQRCLLLSALSVSNPRDSRALRMPDACVAPALDSRESTGRLQYLLANVAGIAPTGTASGSSLSKNSVTATVKELNKDGARDLYTVDKRE